MIDVDEIESGRDLPETHFARARIGDLHLFPDQFLRATMAVNPDVVDGNGSHRLHLPARSDRLYRIARP